MWVIKLGGSLIGSPDLHRWLEAITEAGRRHRLILVAGGGVFADVVRDTQHGLGIDDATAHAMAMQGMRQFALALAGTRALSSGTGLSCVAELTADESPCGVSIWDPLDAALDGSDLPRNWRVTSDSLSLWLCAALHCPHLLLVKSRVPVAETGVALTLARESFVDDYFPVLLQRPPPRVWWFERTQSDQLQALLDGAGNPDHRILAQQKSD